MYYREYDIAIRPFTAQLIHEVMCRQVRHVAGEAMKSIFVVFENGTGKGYFRREDFRTVGDALVQKLVDGQLHANLLKGRFEREIRPLFEVVRQNPAKMDDSQLASAVETFCDVFKASYVGGVVPFLAAFSLEEAAAQSLKEDVGASKVAEYFQTLAAPTGPSWDALEWYDLSRLSGDDLPLHAQLWKWLAYNYESGALPLEHFQDRWPESLADKPKSPWNKIHQGLQRKDELEKKLKLSRRSRILFDAIGDLIYFKEYRKGLQSQALCYFEPFLRQSAKRLALSFNQLKFLTPEEVISALQGDELPNDLAERTAFCVLIQNTEATRLISGAHAHRYYDEAPREDKNLGVLRELKGFCANPGTAQGHACIIRTPEDLPKMKEGDVLVSPMTTPELVPAIKRASAIVTDTGGITCHAAIVSRELNKPCLIGTHHATRVFKDGDLLEVDAAAGWVRKQPK
ncbi:hypothetical protein HYV43_00270 [Candidatus Micrarchaeota archaeon]|nr:hypothetical protein [Candidatus Micrarchaeota archaeon]